jgi:hypothetical protein
MRVYISEQGKGWFELEIPMELKNKTFEEIGNWAYQIISIHKFKGMLVTENPRPFSFYQE